MPIDIAKLQRYLRDYKDLESRIAALRHIKDGEVFVASSKEAYEEGWFVTVPTEVAKKFVAEEYAAKVAELSKYETILVDILKLIPG